ncbi:MAG: hypothetical protein ABJB34_02600 [Acidobacteriota bacterium]
MTGNYFGGGAVAVSLKNVGTISFTGNTVYGGVGLRKLRHRGHTGGRYVEQQHLSRRPRLERLRRFELCDVEGSTGFDSQSNETANPLPNPVVVIPNEQQGGTIVVHASTWPTSINANLSTLGGTNGQGYAIKNAFYLWRVE